MKTSPGPGLSAIVGCLCALLLLAGCFETKQEFTLNPDGSGKVVHETKFQSGISSRQRSSDKQANSAAAKIIRDTKGVDAWRNVSCELMKDGRISFKGTAYFRNLSDLDLPEQTILDFDWVRAPDDTGTLTLRSNQSEHPTANLAQPPEGVSPTELVQLAKESRAKLQEAKGMMHLILGKMKHEVVFHLPGKKRKSAVFKVEPTGTLRMQYEGAKLLEAWETLINDDDWLAHNAQRLDSRGGGPPLDERMSELMFGDKGPASAEVSGLDKVSFDYEAEVSTAKEEFVAIQEKLGPFVADLPYPAPGDALKSLKVVGARLVQAVDESIRMQPFFAKAGYTLVLLAELPSGVHTISDESGLDSAIANDGTDLLPESDYRRSFRFPIVSPDKTTVLLEAEMQVPGPEVSGLKELTGHIRYTVASKTVETDLGFGELAVDAKGKEHGAEIKSISGKSDNGMQTIELRLNLKPDDIKTLHVIAGTEKFELKQRDWQRGLVSYLFTYELEKEFPPQSRLVVETYEDMETFETPFKLENVTLLGRPMK